MVLIHFLSIIDNDKNLRFSGYGQTLRGCEMSFPSFEYLKTGLLGNNKMWQNYFRPFNLHEEFVMDDRAFEKWRKPMAVSILLSKGCVAKCTFCQRGAKGYNVYDLDKLESHLKNLRDNCNSYLLQEDGTYIKKESVDNYFDIFKEFYNMNSERVEESIIL